MSTKVKEEKINEASAYIKDKKWSRAENILLKYRSLFDPRVDYLLGLIYFDYSNPKRNIKKAKEFLERVVQSDAPYENAFILLAKLERSRAHAVRILRKGLYFFPESENLYFNLLSKSSFKEKETIYKKAKEKKIISERIKLNMAISMFDARKYQNSLYILNDINREKFEDEDLEILDCIKGFCYYELGKYKKSKKFFSDIIDEDITHKYDYIPHLGLILSLIEEGSTQEIKRLVNELPSEKIISPILFGFDVNFVCSYHFSKALDSILKVIKERNVQGKIRSLRGLSLCELDIEFAELEKSVKNKIIRDLEFANKCFPKNIKICQHLVWIFGTERYDYEKAWKYLVQYLKNYDEPDYGYVDSDFIEDVPDIIFKKILSDFSQLSKKIHNQKLLFSLFSPIISRLHKTKQYSEVINISRNFSDEQLKDCYDLFEIAFAFYESEDLASAKKYYNFCLKKHGKTASVQNNLGVIYEQENDLIKAKECFEEAMKIDDEELYGSNLKNVQEKIKSQKKEFDKACKFFSRTKHLFLGEAEEIKENLRKISSDELKEMLLRDLIENEVAISLGQHKTALVLSGSIIEAILMDKILEKGIKKYLIGGKNVEILKMELNNLLEVAAKEKIIDAAMKNFALGVKGYRNLIHPGVEKRKKYTGKINEKNAKLAWDIVIKLLYEIK